MCTAVWVQKDLGDAESVTFFVEGAHSFEVVFVRRMPRAAKNVPQVVLPCQQVVLGGHSVVELAVGALAAAASSEIDAEVSGSFAFQFVSLSEAGVDCRLQLVETDSSFLILVGIAVGQVLVVPNVVVVVALYVGCFLLQLSDLTASRPLHPLMSQESLLIFKLLELSFFLLLHLDLLLV